MQKAIKSISLPLPFRMGSVNCYLIETDLGYILIDTGSSNYREALLRQLEGAGCGPAHLQLIVLTHGDFDHTGNAAYLRSSFGGETAMHAGDAGMVESGDMFVNRKKPNPLIRKMIPLFTGFGASERFKPDHLLQDGDDLSAYGMGALILSIPGHSKGSIGILTTAGDLFCGDLLENTRTPVLNSLLDDLAEANESFQRLESLNIRMVYPGHGRPFSMREIKLSNP